MISFVCFVTFVCDRFWREMKFNYNGVAAKVFCFMCHLEGSRGKYPMLFVINSKYTHLGLCQKFMIGRGPEVNKI